MVNCIIKIILSAIILYFIWFYPIDFRNTVLNFFKTKFNFTTWIKTIDQNSIYQNNKIVGNVTGSVIENAGQITFDKISNLYNFDINMPFYYKGKKFKMVKIGTYSGVLLTPTKTGVTSENNVMKNVVCKIVG